jgi:hypothetical protein
VDAGDAEQHVFEIREGRDVKNAGHSRTPTRTEPQIARASSPGANGFSEHAAPLAHSVAGLQVDERIWLVSFMHDDLGYFDDETCRLEPIENPFGPTVLPISSE